MLTARHNGAYRTEPTARQLEVMKLIALGYTGKEIAHELGIAYKTVMKHQEDVFRKLGFHWQGQVVAWAIEHGYFTANAIMYGGEK